MFSQNPKDNPYLVYQRERNGSRSYWNTCCQNCCCQPNVYPFTFHKVDSTTGDPVSGATFALYDANSSLIATEISNANGQVTFSHLQPGMYTLRETIPADGYLPNRIEHSVIIEKNGTMMVDGIAVVHFTIPNTKIPTVSIIKTDDNGIPLSGATFTLSQNGNVLQTIVSDECGSLAIGKLQPGTYTLVETIPPTGYQPNATPYIILVSEDGTITINGETTTNYTIVNTKTVVEYPFSFCKIDDCSNIGISGAVFTLLFKGEPIASATSDSSGYVHFESIPPGSYDLVETTPAPGYLSNTTKHRVVIEEDGQILVDGNDVENFTITNTKAEQSSFSFRKTNICGVPLQGAIFELRQNNAVIQTATSNFFGKVTFDSLNIGTYTLVETVVPEGYQPNLTEYTVIVSSNGSVTIDDTPASQFTMQNESLSHTLLFSKIDSQTQQPIEGAVFELLQSGTQIATATSDGNGMVSFPNLQPNYYILKEVTPAPGYDITLQEHTVSVDFKGNVTVDGMNASNFKIVNTKSGESDYSFSFSKTDENGSGLANATFSLTQNDKAIATAISDASGTVTFDHIQAGEYMLKEETAPSGFEPDTTVYPVQVKPDGTITINQLPVSQFSVIDKQELINITVTKTWIDHNNAENLRPSTVTIALFQDGVQIASAEIETSEGDTQVYVFENFPKYNAAGQEYVYTVDETTLYTGYTSTVTGFDIINIFKNVLITVNHVDANTGNVLLTEHFTVPYHSDFTAHAVSLVGYTLVSAPLYTFYHVVDNAEHSFEYTRLA